MCIVCLLFPSLHAFPQVEMTIVPVTLSEKERVRISVVFGAKLTANKTLYEEVEQLSKERFEQFMTRGNNYVRQNVS